MWLEKWANLFVAKLFMWFRDLVLRVTDGENDRNNLHCEYAIDDASKLS